MIIRKGIFKGKGRKCPYPFFHTGDAMRHYYQEIDKYLKKAIQSVISLEKRGAKNGRVPITLSETLVVRELGKNGPKKIYEMIESLHLDRNTLVSITKNLQLEGYVEKGRSPDDKRSANLSLTSRGEELYRALQEREEELLNVLLEDFSINEEKTVLKFLVKLDLLRRGKLQDQQQDPNQAPHPNQEQSREADSF